MTPHRTLAGPLLLSAFLVAGFVPAGWAEPSAGRRSPEVQAVNKAKAAVVNIHSERTARGPASEEPLAPAPVPHRANGMGTGIIIDPRGYIVTNQHVVEDVSVIRVRLLDGSAYVAKVLARDRENDLAILKIESSRPLPTIPIGASSDLMVGETVIAIGNAYGYEHTVSKGVVSALNRDVTLNKEIAYKALIQTDASINPGNSGGPLLNIDGDMVGVNVAIRAGAQGISFAIPVDRMLQVVTELMMHRRRTDIATGFVCRNHVDTDQNPIRWVKLDRVEPGSPAAKAGLQNGDILLQAGELGVATSVDLERAVLDLKPGDRLPLSIKRGDKEHRVELTLQAGQTTASVAETAWRQLGVRLSPVPNELVTRVSSTLRGGMAVTELNPDSPAAKAGIQKGDVLVGLHQWETVSLDNIAYVLTHPDLGSLYPLRFYVLRSGQVHRGWLPAPE